MTIRITRADPKPERRRTDAEEALIERRRAKQIAWHASLSPEEKRQLAQKREAGQRRYLEGQARLKQQRGE